MDPNTGVVYRRLWHYVLPHKLIGLIAVVAMAATAIIEASLVYLLEPLMDEIDALKQEQDATILAHYYVDSEIQDIADFTGDSLKLARDAAEVETSIARRCK